MQGGKTEQLGRAYSIDQHACMLVCKQDLKACLVMVTYDRSAHMCREQLYSASSGV